MEYSIRPLLPKGTSMHLEHYYVVFSGFSSFNWNLCVGKLCFELSLEHFYGLEQQHKIDEVFIQNPDVLLIFVYFCNLSFTGHKLITLYYWKMFVVGFLFNLLFHFYMKEWPSPDQ